MAWTFGGQDDELVWADGHPYFIEAADDGCSCTADEYDEDEDGNEYLAYEGDECSSCRYGPAAPARRRADKVYFNHELGAGTAVRDAFTAEGFDVEWDQTSDQSVVVTLTPPA